MADDPAAAGEARDAGARLVHLLADGPGGTRPRRTGLDTLRIEGKLVASRWLPLAAAVDAALGNHT